ncbi:MAG: hypothetical protein K6U89_03845 [Chloroflexi bacterium]|nr:hypothetical protein [Chloroflexota bacterium]
MSWAAALAPLLLMLGVLASAGQAPYRHYLPLTTLSRESSLATPNPLAPACANVEQDLSRSWLVNAGLDGPYLAGVPAGWSAFQEGEVRFGEETGREKWGRASWRIEGSGAFRAGAWQLVIGTEPGRWYQAFYATAQRVVGNGRVDGALPLLREVGLDPSGGTRPEAPGVIWGRAAGGRADALAGRYGGWKTLGNGSAPLVSARATGSQMTVFLRVSGWPDVEQGVAWVDSVFFVPACDPAFTRLSLSRGTILSP